MISGTIKQSLRLIGKIVRVTGQSIDTVGTKIQGKYAPIDKLPRYKRVMYMKDKQNPSLDNHVFVAPSATIVGDVNIGKGSSVWYGTVIRGDLASVRIGESSSIGDRAVIHASGKSLSKSTPSSTIIGNHVIVGHGSILKGCTLEDNSIVEMGSIICDDAVVSKESILGSGSLLKEGDIIPSGELWSGSPAKFQRKLTEEEIAEMYNKSKIWENHSNNHDEYHTLIEQEREDERLLIYNVNESGGYIPERHF